MDRTRYPLRFCRSGYLVDYAIPVGIDSWSDLLKSTSSSSTVLHTRRNSIVMINE